MPSHQALQLLSDLVLPRVGLAGLQALSQTCRSLRGAAEAAAEAGRLAAIPPAHPLRREGRDRKEVLLEWGRLQQALSRQPAVQCAHPVRRALPCRPASAPSAGSG